MARGFQRVLCSCWSIPPIFLGHGIALKISSARKTRVILFMAGSWLEQLALSNLSEGTLTMSLPCSQLSNGFLCHLERMKPSTTLHAVNPGCPGPQLPSCRILYYSQLEWLLAAH